MAFGLTVLNNNQQILISDQTRNLHYVGRASFSKIRGSLNQCGAMRVFIFQITCPTIPVPFFSLSEAFTSVIAVRSIAPNAWEIEILRGGSNTIPPDVYVFTDPRGIEGTGGTNYGLKVYCSDGSPSFDSRLFPLVVTGGTDVIPPASPVNPNWYITESEVYLLNLIFYTWWPDKNTSDLAYAAWRSNSMPYDGNLPRYRPLNNWKPNDSGTVFVLWGDKAVRDPSQYLTPTNFNTYSNVFYTNNPNPICFYPSFAQATRIVSGGYYKSDVYKSRSNYWVMYRGGVAKNGDNITCGWIPYVQGSYWEAVAKDGGVSIGSGVDASSIVSAGSGGYPPYANEALNLHPTPVIIANGSRYD